jgi:hypothetical protein
MKQHAGRVKSYTPSAPRPATGADLFKLVANFRRKGHTASFGVDKDPKLLKKAA